MKLLMVFADSITYTPRIKNLEWTEEKNDTETFENILVAFIQVEEKDMQDMKKAETNLVKNLKWGARKNNTKKILLHSFAHLSESKATPEFTKQLLDNAQQRLNNADYLAYQSPFGYFLDISIQCPGKSLARVFKSF